MEDINPIETNTSGKEMQVTHSVVVAPIVSAAITDPAYDSKRSAPIPAVSPTQSPTLSAMTPGFLGSSSGIPSSSFPTRSEPISALFVKIPPPTLANKATVEAPKAKPRVTVDRTAKFFDVRK